MISRAMNFDAISFFIENPVLLFSVLKKCPTLISALNANPRTQKLIPLFVVSNIKVEFVEKLLHSCCTGLRNYNNHHYHYNRRHICHREDHYRHNPNAKIQQGEPERISLCILLLFSCVKKSISTGDKDLQQEW